MRRGLIIGILGWLFDFALFRYFGHHLLTPELFTAVYLVSGAIVVLVTVALCRYVCEKGKHVRFGAGMAIPGLLGSAASVMAFQTFFPGMAAERSGAFAALMLWGNGLILVAVLLFGDKVVREN